MTGVLHVSVAATLFVLKSQSGMLAGLHPRFTVPAGHLRNTGLSGSAVQVYVTVLVARFWQMSVTIIVKVRFDAQAAPPSACVPLVDIRLQLSLACTWASTSDSLGILAGLQPSGTVPCGALIPGGVVSTVQEMAWMQLRVLPQTLWAV